MEIQETCKYQGQTSWYLVESPTGYDSKITVSYVAP